jgi:hypothetical protein
MEGFQIISASLACRQPISMSVTVQRRMATSTVGTLSATQSLGISRQLRFVSIFRSSEPSTRPRMWFKAQTHIPSRLSTPSSLRGPAQSSPSDPSLRHVTCIMYYVRDFQFGVQLHSTLDGAMLGARHHEPCKINDSLCVVVWVTSNSPLFGTALSGKSSSLARNWPAC